MSHLRNAVQTVATAILFTLASHAAHAQVSDRLSEIIEAYGGEEALLAINTFEYDWTGYFIGRYQSRYTEPPYDRLPVRNWSAVDFDNEVSVYDTISTWPGELNMGTRTINDGGDGWYLNTISQIYTDGVMYSHAAIVGGAASRMPWVLVRNMIGHPDQFEAMGTHEHRGITYDVIAYNGQTYWVHPETSLIYAGISRGGNMTDVEVDVLRTYTHYFEINGIMVNRRYKIWNNTDETSDMELYDIAFNADVSQYLSIPEGFLYVPSMDGYNGVWEIGVEELGSGVYLAGNGETRILYVEFDDYFVAMEAGGMPDYAEETYNAMQPYMNGKPLRYIIPTHHHDDHAVAIHFYARIGATILTTRDKEGFLRRLLARSWGDDGPVTDAQFSFIEEERLVLADDTNRLDIIVYQDAPHTENMLVAYLPGLTALYSCDIFIGWIGDEVRQGAPYGVRQLDQWIDAQQSAGSMGEVDLYIAVHGRPYSADDMSQMLATERVVVTLPDNESWPTATWFERYGLSDDTVGSTRRGRVVPGPALH